MQVRKVSDIPARKFSCYSDVTKEKIMTGFFPALPKRMGENVTTG